MARWSGGTSGPDLRWLAGWVVICALAEWLGIGAAVLWYGAVLSAFGEPVALAPRIGVWLTASAAALPEAIVLGGLQAFWLRTIWPGLSAARWILATMAVGLIGWGVGAFIPLFMFPESGGAAQSPAADPTAAFDPSLGAIALFATLFGLAVGAVFGLGQALALPTGSRARRLWIIGNAAGWAVGLPLIYVAAHLASDLPGWGARIGLWMAGGLGAGLAVGAATAVVLRLMARPP
jgi:hypothetical protein